MNTPDDRQYRNTHEWVLEQDGTVLVGITDFAQDQLGDVVFVELPQVGRAVQEGDTVAVVESVKTASDIYAPVSGTISAVNDDLDAKPELINEDPYDRGWLFRIEPDGDLPQLLTAPAYNEVAEEEG